MQVRPGGYRELLASETRLRSLWLGTLVSSLGDWLRHVSVLALVISLTGAGLEMGLVCVLEFIPLIFFGPLTGAVVDRWNVRRLMVGADLCRAGLSLSFLLVDSTSEIWIAYGATAAIAVLDLLFQAARQTLTASLVRPERYLTVSGLFSLTSGACLAGGSILAPLVMGWAGRDVAFLLDAATFLLSAGLLFSMKDGKEKAPAPVTAGKGCLRGYGEEILAGLRYIRGNRKVSGLITFNAARFAGSGAMYVLLGAFGSRVFQGGDSGVGIFYASFGKAEPNAAHRVLATWEDVQYRVKEFMLCLLFMMSGMIGVFVSLDMFLFYVFWELQLIPMY
ncbi:MAG: hypothetical protein HGA78_12205, partial [Nitrospirales bacterium]|nr:hypothetical protein [Nitrospirales bacterium]